VLYIYLLCLINNIIYLSQITNLPPTYLPAYVIPKPALLTYSATAASHAAAESGRIAASASRIMGKARRKKRSKGKRHNPTGIASSSSVVTSTQLKGVKVNHTHIPLHFIFPIRVLKTTLRVGNRRRGSKGTSDELYGIGTSF